MRKFLTILLFFIVIFIAMKLGADGKSYNDEKLKQEDRYEYYKDLEDRFTIVLRKTLEDDGYPNAGITLTSVIYPGGVRHYSASVHHERFNKLDEKEKDEYISRLSRVEFPDYDCSVEYNLTYF